MTYRIQIVLQGGQTLGHDVDSWLKAEDGSIFQTDDPTEAEKLATDYNIKQEGRKGSDRMRFAVVKFDTRLDIPVLGQGQN